MNILKKYYKPIFALITAITILSCLTVDQYIGAEIEIEIASLGGALVAVLVAVVIAVNLIPIIANETATLETNADLSSNEQGLVSIWPLLVVIGVMVGIVVMFM